MQSFLIEIFSAHGGILLQGKGLQEKDKDEKHQEKLTRKSSKLMKPFRY